MYNQTCFEINTGGVFFKSWSIIMWCKFVWSLGRRFNVRRHISTVSCFRWTLFRGWAITTCTRHACHYYAANTFENPGVLSGEWHHVLSLFAIHLKSTYTFPCFAWWIKSLLLFLIENKYQHCSSVIFVGAFKHLFFSFYQKQTCVCFHHLFVCLCDRISVCLFLFVSLRKNWNLVLDWCSGIT